MNKSGETPEQPARRRLFTTQAQADYRRGGRKRLAGALAVAVIAIVAVVMLGPGEEVVKEKFEYYGAPDDEMRIMPEISIDQGSDRIHQVPKSLQVPPPPANMDVIEDEDDPDPTEILPEDVDDDPNELDVAVDQPIPDAEVSQDHQVELLLPSQTSTDYFILNSPRPEYPLTASETERRTPVIFVNFWIFVETDGTVSAVSITSTNGGKIFENEVIETMMKWKFGWRVEQTKGRAFTMTCRFKSPYFNPGRNQDN